jgi:hypothetical protein
MSTTSSERRCQVAHARQHFWVPFSEHLLPFLRHLHMHLLYLVRPLLPLVRVCQVVHARQRVWVLFSEYLLPALWRFRCHLPAVCIVSRLGSVLATTLEERGLLKDRLSTSHLHIKGCHCVRKNGLACHPIIQVAQWKGLI